MDAYVSKRICRAVSVERISMAKATGNEASMLIPRKGGTTAKVSREWTHAAPK
jgi:hypothetical protein